ncbi:2a3e9512-39dc-4de5-a46b-48f5bfbeca70 [Sclerotinia trifoliorum]|uniref:2a3e9512-39dc-4de5-a46b-48f5bfbeca70 n=1 Tax=Sclerotinia trifoliorum TaxID=28548 RepID=A0A8H2ZPB0_9HELO|nr:2a3e9512-39dc-4de5-a46b-48f5bfbeca70 [Sclerotinia trifoliorum]
MSWIIDISPLHSHKPTKLIAVWKLQKYNLTERELHPIALEAPDVKTTEEKLSKLVDWMQAPMPNALCFFSGPPPSDPPGSAPILSTHTSDATKRITYGCISYGRRLVCCLSDFLDEKQPITGVIRFLVAQLLRIYAGELGKKFRSEEFSDI